MILKSRGRVMTPGEEIMTLLCAFLMVKVEVFRDYMERKKEQCK